MKHEDGRGHHHSMVLKFAFRCSLEVKMLRKTKLGDEMYNSLQLALYSSVGCVSVVKTCRKEK